MCRAEFLNYLRVREWQDLHGQLQSLSADLGLSTDSSSSERARVHTALLAGLLSHVGMKVVLTRPRPGTPGGRAWPPSAARVPRRPRHPVRDLPRLRARPQAAGLGGRRRARRDLPALGPHRRRDRAGMGRTGRRAPGQAVLQRAPLVQEPRRRHRHGEGHPLRHPDRRRPHGELRTASTRSPPASCSSGTPSSKATGKPGTTSSATTPRCSTKPPNSSSAPAAAAWSPARTRSSSSTTPASPPT